ncbi:MAG: hypothetical protein MUD04_13285, partial [Cyanobium sp. Prado107]|nr:hypothetical protein [Cyanobium sp. Prado107]
FTFTSPGGVPTFSNISVTATCFEGSTTSTANPCDVFGPNNNTNTVTFTNIVQYLPATTSTIVFNNLDQTGSDVLRVRFTGGGLVDALGQTRNVTTAATPNESFFCSSSTGNPRVTCDGTEQVQFTTFTGSLRAVPSPFSALLLLPLGPLALLRRRLRARLSGMNA